MPKLIDLTGQRFGRLVVIRRDHGKFWECLCDCGNIHVVNRDHLGIDTNSCGCLKKEMLRAKRFRHGEARTRLHRIWCSMNERCNNPNTDERHIYYDRGIRVCDEWKSYEAFRDWALANGYDPKAKRGVTTIDRIDNNKGYSPDNCRWVDNKANQRNRRDTKRYEFRGKHLTRGEIAEITGIPTALIGDRMRRGWSLERAALAPVRITSRTRKD